MKLMELKHLWQASSFQTWKKYGPWATTSPLQCPTRKKNQGNQDGNNETRPAQKC